MSIPTRFRFVPTEQEILFAKVIASTGSFSEAWLLAGFKDGGETKNYNRAIRLAKKDKIVERVGFYRDELVKRGDVSANEVISETKSVAFSNIKDFLNSDNEISLDGLSRDQLAAVKQLDVIQTEFGVTHKVIFYDKLQALEKLFKMLNLFESNQRASIVLNLGKQEQINVIEQN